MYCPQCDEELIEGALFCSNCGKAIQHQTISQQQNDSSSEALNNLPITQQTGNSKTNTEEQTFEKSASSPAIQNVASATLQPLVSPGDSSNSSNNCSDQAAAHASSQNPTAFTTANIPTPPIPPSTPTSCQENSWVSNPIESRPSTKIKIGYVSLGFILGAIGVLISWLISRKHGKCFSKDSIKFSLLGVGLFMGINIMLFY